MNASTLDHSFIVVFELSCIQLLLKQTHGEGKGLEKSYMTSQWLCFNKLHTLYNEIRIDIEEIHR